MGPGKTRDHTKEKATTTIVFNNPCSEKSVYLRHWLFIFFLQIVNGIGLLIDSHRLGRGRGWLIVYLKMFI